MTLQGDPDPVCRHPVEVRERRPTTTVASTPIATITTPTAIQPSIPGASQPWPGNLFRRAEKIE